MESSKKKAVAAPGRVGKARDRRMTSHEWGVLISLLRSGTHTQKELSEMYGVSVNSIHIKRKKMGGIKIGEASTSKTVLTKIDKTAMAAEKAIGFSAAESSNLITEAKRTTFRRIENLGKIAEVLLSKKIHDGSNNFASLKDDFKVILDGMSIFEKQLNLVALCLGFEDGKFESGSNIPELIIRKMDEGEIIDIQSRTLDNDEDDMLDEDEDAT